jgi:hypothetical protein
MAASPKAQTDAWIATATAEQLRDLLSRIVEADMQAAVLVYQNIQVTA